MSQERLNVLALLSDPRFTLPIQRDLGGQCVLTVKQISTGTIPQGAWDFIVIQVPTYQDYIYCASLVDVSYPLVPRILLGWAAVTDPAFRCLPLGAIWQCVPETSEQHWSLVISHLLLERRMDAERRRSAARIRFLSYAAHSETMRDFCGQVEHEAAGAVRVIVTCKRVDDEAYVIADGILAYMPSVGDREPCVIDAADPAKADILVSDVSGRVGLLARAQPLILVHPLSLSEDRAHALWLSVAGEYPYPVLFLLDADEVLALRRVNTRERSFRGWLKRLQPRLNIPPFRERPEEVLWHLQSTADPGRIPPDMMVTLLNHVWQSAGQLNEFLTRLRSTGEMPALPEADADISFKPSTSCLESMVNLYRRAILAAALKHTSGRVQKAAKLLGVPERTLRRHMDDLGTPKEWFRARMRRKRR